MTEWEREKHRINHALGKAGFGQLSDRGLIQQLAYCVRDSEHFRNLLVACVPEERNHMYEAMRPYLKFRAKPLDAYIAEARADAEARQLPVQKPDGTLEEYRVPEAASKSDDENDSD